eukprot:6797804-Prymnesium_polylepis.2
MAKHALGGEVGVERHQRLGRRRRAVALPAGERLKQRACLCVELRLGGKVGGGRMRSHRTVLRHDRRREGDGGASVPQEPLRDVAAPHVGHPRRQRRRQQGCPQCARTEESCLCVERRKCARRHQQQLAEAFKRERQLARHPIGGVD